MKRFVLLTSECTMAEEEQDKKFHFERIKVKNKTKPCCVATSATVTVLQRL